MLYSGSGVLSDTEVVAAEAIKIPTSSKLRLGLELMSKKFEPILIERPYAGLACIRDTNILTKTICCPVCQLLTGQDGAVIVSVRLGLLGRLDQRGNMIQ